MTARGSPAEAAELLPALIRNRCVNDGSGDSTGSADEGRNAKLLGDHLGLEEVELLAPPDAPDRCSLVARLEGSDPRAPTLLLLGRTDVAAAHPVGWRHDPFGGDRIDGEVWGRGAADLLGPTAAMAMAVRHLAAGPRLRGTLILVAAADGEGDGRAGILHLLDRIPELRDVDAVLTAGGGLQVGSGAAAVGAGGPEVAVAVSHPGMLSATVHVCGPPLPPARSLAARGAMATAADVVLRLEQGGCHPTRLRILPELNAVPTDAFIGVEVPVPASEAVAAHDQRTLAEGRLRRLLDGVAALITVESFVPAAVSGRVSGLWADLERSVAAELPGARLVPSASVGCAGGGPFRAMGIPTFGFGLLSAATSDRYWSMVHGVDERIDLESLRLSCGVWDAVARRYLS